MMAQHVPHQATDRKRVKVYELRNNDWFDRGTGFCTAGFATADDGRKDPKVQVESEEDPSRMLLETSIKKEDGFQKQQDTLIVWQEPGTMVDMALSFQEAEGCSAIWKFIEKIQETFQNTLAGEDGLSDDLAVEVHPTITLPDAELGNLPDIEQSIRVMSATVAGREALMKAIISEEYISKLTPLVSLAEDLESLQDLHRLCNIMKQIILTNDTTVIEQAVSDACILGVVGALEYDPDFPSHKANHRQWLSNEGRYKEVVPIEDEATRRKIHQTYRLQYLKDVVLARILDDPTFSVLNSLIFFNQVDIVHHLQTTSSFLQDLFAIFRSPFPDEKRKKEAVLLISQCCTIAKNLQPPARAALYASFLLHGLLSVVSYGLRHTDVGVRVGATDILASVIDHDPHMIKQTIYRQISDNAPLLTDSLVDLLLIEGDLGVKSSITDALKLLLDLQPAPQTSQTAIDQFPKMNGEFAARQRSGSVMDPQQEIFLTRFYEQSAPKLFKPLTDLENKSSMEFAPQHAAMFTYLVELLCYFIRLHHRYSKAFVMHHSLIQRISQLLDSPEKHLQLLAIRFTRSLIGLQEEFYVKQLLENDSLGPILEVMYKSKDKDNLLSSACLELFEHVKKESQKDFGRHLVANHRPRLESLCAFATFDELIGRYDQTEGFTHNVDFLESDDAVMSDRMQGQRSEMMDSMSLENSYWDNLDDDEEGEQLETTDIAADNASVTSSASKPLVDYPSDEEADENVEAAIESEEVNGETAITTDADKTESAAPPPERIAEKRRREEDEEDELGKLVGNKRRSSGDSILSSNTVSPGLSRHRKSFSAGSGNGTPKKISISLSPALKSGGMGGRSDDES